MPRELKDVHERTTIWIKGAAATPLGTESGLPLETLIYHATFQALETSGVGLSQVDAVCMAASDLFDGRGISTMTLTGSTGSFGKSEIRVCEDGLAALSLAGDELASGAARCVIVSAWSSLSGADVSAISLLNLEPAFLRPLALRQEVILALASSFEQRTPTVVTNIGQEVGDGACALVLTAGDDAGAVGRFIAYGSSTGPYVRPSADPLKPAGEAVRRAFSETRLTSDDLLAIHCGGFHGVPDDVIRTKLGLSDVSLFRPEPRGIDFGYCNGLIALEQALTQQPRGPRLILSSAGAGLQKTYAAIVDTGPG